MITIYNMDVMKALKQMPSESVDMQITSPPYWGLRDYGSDVEVIWDGNKSCGHKFITKERKIHSGTTKSKISGDNSGHLNEFSVKDNFCKKCGAWKGQLGLEPNFNLYIKHLCDIFEEVKRVLKKDGTCWVNLGDTYSAGGGAGKGEYRKRHTQFGKIVKSESQSLGRNVKGMQPKCLCGIPERFMLGMIERGWILRNKIIWHKPNHMPTSVKDRFANSWEYLFLFVKNNETLFWTNEKTKELVTQQPLGIHGKENEDWEWRECSSCKGKGCKSCKNLGKKKYSFWDGHDYYFDLDAVREPHKTHENRPMGIIRERTLKYKSKKNLNPEAFNSPRARLDRENYSEEQFYNPKGKNPDDFWNITTQPFKEAHFAVFPEKLVERPIKTTRKNAIILDIFAGSGTTLKVARDLGRSAIGIEIKPEYIKIIKKRLMYDKKSNRNLLPDPKIIKNEKKE